MQPRSRSIARRILSNARQSGVSVAIEQTNNYHCPNALVDRKYLRERARRINIYRMLSAATRYDDLAASSSTRCCRNNWSNFSGCARIIFGIFPSPLFEERINEIIARKKLYFYKYTYKHDKIRITSKYFILALKNFFLVNSSRHISRLYFPFSFPTARCELIAKSS